MKTPRLFWRNLSQNTSMTSQRRGTSIKAGLPPGTPIYIGDQRLPSLLITHTHFAAESARTEILSSMDEFALDRAQAGVTWLNIDGLHDVQAITALCEKLGIHSLVLEDILNTDQRPKVEDYGEFLFVVVKMLQRDSATKAVAVEQVSFVLGKNYLLSFQENIGDVFDPVRLRIKEAKGKVRKRGADYLLYGLLDAIVDQYFVILEDLADQLEELQDHLFENATGNLLQEIHRYRGELIHLRKPIWPLRELLAHLLRGDSPLIEKMTLTYLRDIYDHTMRVSDGIESSREMLQGMFDTYLSWSNHRLNAVMKVLTIITTIFMPLTFIVGIYGMNFRFMPELEWQWSYPLLLVFLFAVGTSLGLYFKKKRWL